MAKKKKPLIEEEIIYVSKSELKREAMQYHGLGAEIAKMPKKQRDRLPLNHDLKEALVVSDKVSDKSDAYRRNLNYIAKVLRNLATSFFLHWGISSIPSSLALVIVQI